MPRMKDRMRLKDRILENIAKSVRLIQDFQSRPGDELFVLTNSDWQLQRLIGHLDHAFLHGLRHVTNGYWILVQDFTHKSTVKEIQKLNNVTTDLGRGRAWLYQALNDRLLESYTRCYLDNKQLVKKYYVKEALVLDEQRLHILVTLASGLEMAYFQLEINVPYLDLVSSMKMRSSEAEESDDRLSVSSYDSSVSQMSCSTSDVFSESGIILPSRGQRSFSIDCIDHKTKKLHPSMSLPLIESDVSMASEVLPQELTSENAKIEVIHLTGKTRKKKSTGKRIKCESVTVMLPPTEQSPDCDDKSLLSGMSTDTVTPTTPESGYRSTVENRFSWQQDSVSENELTREESLAALSLNNNSKDRSDGDESIKNPETSRDKVVLDSKDSRGKNQSAPISIQIMKDLNWSPKELQLVQSLNEISIISKEKYSEHKSISVDSQDAKSSHKYEDTEKLNKDTSENFGNKTKSPENTVDLENPVLESNSQCSNDTVQKPEQSIYDNDESSKDHSNKSDLCYSDDKAKPDEAVSQNQVVSDTSLTSSTGASSPDRLTDDSQDSSSSNYHRSKRRNDNKQAKNGSKVKKDHDAEVIVDNNLMLLLMLEVFEVEDEKLVKMYQTCIGHTEGSVTPIYVLLSDAALYLLTTNYGQKKFKKEGTVKYRELDYISLSLNYQVINIVCTNRRKKFWITTGDEQLTRCIVSQLDFVLRKCETSLSALSVLTDATTQKIAIKKWLAAECKMEMTDVNIVLYRLVNWEDLNDDHTACPVSTTNKEGILYYKTEPGLFFGSYWKEAFFVLKDGFLCQYADRHDNQPPKLTIQLNQEDCVGCRHCNLDDRQHCFEVILANGNSLQLSAPSQSESREWLQCLCKAISQGTGLPVLNPGVLSCCSVLTSTHIFLFHEDVETNFCRTLASGQLMDLVNVQLDSGAQIYVILVFQSQTVQSYSRRWVLYFNTVPERDSFLSYLSKAWKSLFHVALPKSSIKDTKLRARCRAGIGRLRKQRRV